jgi:hypothetical protein
LQEAGVVHIILVLGIYVLSKGSEQTLQFTAEEMLRIKRKTFFF